MGLGTLGRKLKGNLFGGKLRQYASVGKKYVMSIIPDELKRLMEKKMKLIQK